MRKFSRTILHTLATLAVVHQVLRLLPGCDYLPGLSSGIRYAHLLVASRPVLRRRGLFSAPWRRTRAHLDNRTAVLSATWHDVVHVPVEQVADVRHLPGVPYFALCVNRVDPGRQCIQSALSGVSKMGHAGWSVQKRLRHRSQASRRENGLIV